MAISVAPTEQQATVAVAIALVIAPVQRIEVAGQIAAEVRPESALPIALRFARAIDLAAREIAAPELAEIASGVATWEAVLPGVPSETAPDTTLEKPAQVAAGALKASAVRVADLAEPAAAVVVVALAQVAAAVVAVAAAADSNVSSGSPQQSN